MKYLKYLMLAGLLVTIMSCSTLASRVRTECTVENKPTIAVVTVYESEIFNADSPSGYTNENVQDITEELKRLGFEPINVDPMINEEIKYSIESTIRHKKRFEMISSILAENYDYFLYISIQNKYLTAASSDEYTVKLTTRIQLLNEDLLIKPEETKLDDVTLYDTYKVDSKREAGKNMSRTDLKRRSLNTYEGFILNFFNEYVRKIRNYEYAIQGEKPICLNFNYNTNKPNTL